MRCAFGRHDQIDNSHAIKRLDPSVCRGLSFPSDVRSPATSSGRPGTSRNHRACVHCPPNSVRLYKTFYQWNPLAPIIFGHHHRRSLAFPTDHRGLHGGQYRGIPNPDAIVARSHIPHNRPLPPQTGTGLIPNSFLMGTRTCLRPGHTPS